MKFGNNSVCADFSASSTYMRQKSLMCAMVLLSLTCERSMIDSQLPQPNNMSAATIRLRSPHDQSNVVLEFCFSSAKRSAACIFAMSSTASTRRSSSAAATSGMSFCQNSGSSSATPSAEPPSSTNVAVANVLGPDAALSEFFSALSMSFCSERARISVMLSAFHCFARPSSSVNNPYAPCLSKSSISFRDAADDFSSFSAALPKMACSSPSFIDARVNISFS